MVEGPRAVWMKAVRGGGSLGMSEDRCTESRVLIEWGTDTEDWAESQDDMQRGAAVAVVAPVVGMMRVADEEIDSGAVDLGDDNELLSPGGLRHWARGQVCLGWATRRGVLHG